MDVEGDSRSLDDGETRRRTADEAIAEVAAGQHGVVSREQLLARGVGREAIRLRLRQRRLTGLHRGVYLVGVVAPPLAYEQAALLAAGPHAVLSHSSAARLHGLLPYPARRAAVDVTVTCGHRSGDRWVEPHHAALSRTEWWTRSGLRVTTPLRTLLDLAATAPGLVEPVLREALARHLVTVPALAAAVGARPGHRGTGRLRALLDTHPRLTRSHAERRLLDLVRRARLPEPETNVRVGRWEVDMLWREQCLVVEVDGYAAHSSPDAFERDHAREADLRAIGLRLRRFSARQIEHESEAVLASLARELR